MPEALKLAAEKCALAASYGFIGVFPLDNALTLDSLEKPDQARRIAAANEGLMRGADAMIANLTPFRGVSMDSGTAFEVGFMRALGRPVTGYTTVIEDYAARSSYYRSLSSLPYDGDRPEYDIEDFRCTENLMITSAIEASGFSVVIDPTPPASLSSLSGFEACLNQLRAHFDRIQAA
ncbi:MAG: hypothetical protein RLZ98_2190 [Pseudomonadota bacterium]|jgi:nucleoside 2-deoxyribosyltransferase